jgi:hypothetical protein
MVGGWLPRLVRRKRAEGPLLELRGRDLRRFERRRAELDAMRETIWSGVPWPLLAPADFDGPRWLGGWGASGGRLNAVELGHGDPRGDCVRVTVHQDPASLSDPEDEPRAGSVVIDVDGEPVALERLDPEQRPSLTQDGRLREIAEGPWGPYGLEVSVCGRPLDGLRLVRVTDPSPYRADPPGA